VLLADEPTGNLDEDTRDEIINLLEKLWRVRGLTLVLVTHDTAIAVAGLKRYGFASEAAELATGLLDAARHFPLFRFPELFCGFPRAETSVPVAYPVACSPQAWAAASPFLLLRALLGIEADAPNRELRVTKPSLPHPVRRLMVEGLRVGDAEVDLLFQAWRGTTACEVLRRRGDVSIVVRL